MTEFYTCVNKYGNNILYRGYESGTGERIARKIPFSPTLYVPSGSEETGYTALDGVRVKPREFSNMKEARDFCEAHRDIENFRVYGNQNYVAQFIYDRFPGDIDFDPSLVNVVSIDIEVAVNDEGFPHPEEAKQPVTAITLKSSRDSTYYVFGTKEFDESASEYSVKYIHCTDEGDLLIRFLEYWDSESLSPDVVTGWNTQLFDIPYLVNRINKIVGSDMLKKMSPWRVINQRTVMMMKKPREAYVLYGIQQLDYMDLFKKFGYTYGEQENYRLDTIANTVLGERKLSYEEYSNLDDLYEHDYQKFLEYNIRDVELIHRIDEKLGLINLALTMAYRGGVNYTDTFGTTGIWDTIIYRTLMDRNIVVPPNEDTHKAKYDGGYVKDPKIGLHKWVVSLDLNSLYPSIIVQNNMSPEMLAPRTKDNVTVQRCLDEKVEAPDGYALAANGALFQTSERGVIPEIVASMYKERKSVKKEMLQKKTELEEIDKELRKRGVN
jgi:DNA polymerase elongation subunit (family B)